MKLFFLPLGEGSLYAAQIGGVGFHSFPGEGAATFETAIKVIHGTHEKKQCNLYYYVAKPCFHSKIFPLAFAYSCSNNRLGVPPPQCNLWFHLFLLLIFSTSTLPPFIFPSSPGEARGIMTN
jgi:hypothetical protein